MKQTFDYLENVALAATVCDKEGIVLYQNATARGRDGDVVGQNLYNCHGPKAADNLIRTSRIHINPVYLRHDVRNPH